MVVDVAHEDRVTASLVEVRTGLAAGDGRDVRQPGSSRRPGDPLQLLSADSLVNMWPDSPTTLAIATVSAPSPAPISPTTLPAWRSRAAIRRSASAAFCCAFWADGPAAVSATRTSSVMNRRAEAHRHAELDADWVHNGFPNASVAGNRRSGDQERLEAGFKTSPGPLGAHGARRPRRADREGQRTRMDRNSSTQGLAKSSPKLTCAVTERTEDLSCFVSPVQPLPPSSRFPTQVRSPRVHGLVCLLVS